jgi:hypothetical protein
MNTLVRSLLILAAPAFAAWVALAFVGTLVLALVTLARKGRV